MSAANENEAVFNFNIKLAEATLQNLAYFYRF
jgi:hypothetical protein